MIYSSMPTRAEDEGKALVEAAIITGLRVRMSHPTASVGNITKAVQDALDEEDWEDHDAVLYNALFKMEGL